MAVPVNRMRVGVAVLHYRFWPHVCETLDAVLAQTRAPEEFLLVDNGSGDDSATRLRERYPELDIIEVPENHGPLPGMNIALGALLERDIDAALFLTHECRMAPDALEAMVARLEEDSRVGAVGPLVGLLSRPDTVWSAGGYIHPRTWDTMHLVEPDEMSLWRGRRPHEADWLDGCCLLLRAEAARATGMVNEKFYYFFDEPEYLLRLRSRGWRVECVPAALAWQEPGKPSAYIYARNRLGFLAGSAPRRYLARELVRVLYYSIRGAIRPRPGEQRVDAWRRLRGLIDFVRSRWGRPPVSMIAPRPRN